MPVELVDELYRFNVGRKSAFGGQPSAVSTVFIGDSLTGNGFLSDGTVTHDEYGPYYAGGLFARTEDYGFAAFAEFLANGGLGNVVNAGIGGNTTIDILARVEADVLAHNPRLVVDECGTNDIIAGSTAADIITRKGQLFDYYDSIGAAIIAADISPRSGFDNAKVNVAADVNNWLYKQAASRRNLSVFPLSAILADPASFTGAVSAARTYDDTHPNNLGAYLGGQLLLAVARPGLFMPIPRSNWTGGAYGSSNANAIIRNSNPGMAYVSGGTANTGVTGQVADGYTCSRLAGTPSVVASVVSRNDGLGFSQRLEITFGAAGDAIEFGIPTASGRYLSGRKIGVRANLEFLSSSADIVNRCILYSAAVVGGQTYQVTALNQQNSTRRANLPLSTGGVSGLAKSPRLSVPAGAASGYSTQLRIYASAAGVVTVDVSQFMLTQHP